MNTGSQRSLAATTLRCKTLELLVALAIFSSGYHNTGEKASTDGKTREKQTHVRVRAHTHTHTHTHTHRTVTDPYTCTHGYYYSNVCINVR